MSDAGREWLAHHGVKGMKWGVRKSRSARPGSKSNPITPSADAQRHHTNLKKHKSQLSDQDLRDLVNRLNTEQQLSRLTGDGKSAVQKILDRSRAANNLLQVVKSPAGQLAIAAGAAVAVKLIRTNKAVSSIGQFG